MTVDLAPYLGAVPDAVVDRLRGARRVLAVSHENPDADTLGATLAVGRLVEALGGTADLVCTDPVPPLYDFMAGVERFRTDPDTTAPYDLLVISDCGSLERIGEVGVRHAELFERLPRVIIDHHASNDAAGDADWIDPAAAATCEMVALLAGRLGVGLDSGEGALAAALMAGIVMDTATFAHPNATPRTLVVSAALVEAGAPLSDISRRLYRTKPDAQLRLFGIVLDRLESADDGRVVWSSLTDADIAATGAEARPLGGHHRPPLAGRGGRGRDPVQGSGGRQGDSRERPDQAGRRRRDGPDRAVRGRRSRAGGRRLDRGAARRGAAGRPRRGEPARRRTDPLIVARSSLGPGLDGILIVAKPAGPTSHDIVALVRRLAATKRVGHGGTLDPFASGVLPVFLGHGTRVVEYHLGDRKAYRATICFGAASTTDDLEGELTPADGPAPTREAVEAALAGFTGTISQRPPAYSAIKVAGRRAYAMARAGEAVELAPREVTIHSLDLVSWDDADPDRPIAVVDVTCSAGTYIRALARDLGRATGECRLPRRPHPDRLRPVHARGGDAARPDPDGSRRRPCRAPALPESRSTRASSASRSSPSRRTRSRPSREASTSGRRRACPGRPSGTASRTPAGALVAIASGEAGRLAPDKVFVAPVAAGAGSPAAPVG